MHWKLAGKARRSASRSRGQPTTGITAMAIGLLGRKVGMTQIFDEDGNVVPVTVIQAGPCHVLQLRTKRSRRLRSRANGLRRQAPPTWPVAATVVTSPSSTASVSKARGQGGRRDSAQGRLRAAAVHPRIPRPGRGRRRRPDSSTSRRSPTSSASTSSAPARAAARPASWCGTTFRASGPRTA